MPAAINENLWAKIKAAYMADESQTNGSVAKRFNVSKSAVDKRAAAEGWKLKRESQAIASEAIAEEVAAVLEKPVQAKAVRPHLSKSDPLAYVELALSECYADLENIEIKPKSKGEVISSLERMLKLQHQISLYKHDEEMREIQRKKEQSQAEKEGYEAIIMQRQAHPPDIAGIVDMVLALGLDLTEIMRQIKARALEIG
jgi:hypothetical protein